MKALRDCWKCQYSVVMIDDLNRDVEPKRCPACGCEDPCGAGTPLSKSFAEHGEQAIELVFSELRKAEAKHPGWPDDKIHAVGILVEEAGEAMQAAIDCTYAGGDIELLRKELAQTGAMAIRALLHLPGMESRGA